MNTFLLPLIKPLFIIFLDILPEILLRIRVNVQIVRSCCLQGMCRWKRNSMSLSVRLQTKSMPRSFVVKSITRGGSSEPSDALYVTWFHAIMSDANTKKILMLSDNPRDVFVKSFNEQLEQNCNTPALYETQCKQNHSFTIFIGDTACTMFNIFAKNLTLVANSKVHQQRKRISTSSDPKMSSSSRKLKKITSS